MRLLRALPVLSVLIAAALTPAAQAAPTITEFAAGTGPVGIARGADGNVWFADQPNPGAIGKISPAGVVVTYNNGNAGMDKDADPTGIAGGPGGLWATLTGKDKILRISTAGTATQFDSGAKKPVGITAGPDGNLWFASIEGDGAIGRITPTGAVTKFTTGLTPKSQPQSIARGSDGNLWFTEPVNKRVGRITPQGKITEFGTGALLGTPQEITAGPDGNVWFTENGALGAAIARVTPSGGVTEFSAGLPPGSAPQGIAAGADGNIYFTDPGANRIGRITPQGSITMFGGITSGAGLAGITTGGDGRLWFAESAKGKIGRMSVAPTAGQTTASDVTDVTAVLAAPVTPNSEATDYSFQWGPDTSYSGQPTASTPAGSGAGAQTATASLTGLSPTTTYHARVVATNATGTTYGPDMTFSTTAPGAPSATTDPATGVGSADATIKATVNPLNGTTTYRFEWGTDTTYGSQLPLTDATLAFTDATDHPVTELLQGLGPNTRYHYRVVATNQTGTTYGADQSFITTEVPADATTGAPTGVNPDGATLTGTVNPQNSATGYHFEWGLTTAYGSSFPELDVLVGSDDTTYPVSQDLAGLQPNKTYHFRLVATNNAGVTTGGDQQFSTAAVAPRAHTIAATDVSQTSATLRGNVNAQNSAALSWFEWGTTNGYGKSTQPANLAGDVDDHAVQETLTGLAPNTRYHFRVVSQSAAGMTYGDNHTFVTKDVPAADARPETPGAPGSSGDENGDGAPRAVLGQKAVATVTKGTVRFRPPGSATAVEVDGDAQIPSGSVIDTRNGTLTLVTQVDASGRTQAAKFAGAIFRMSLRRTGIVDLSLPETVSCPSTRGKARAAAAKRTVKLWARDSNGRYRTRGRGSVATVRGTEWTTTETCRGTLTRVVKGAVSVWDRGAKRRVLVRAGHAHLAHVLR